MRPIFCVIPENATQLRFIEHDQVRGFRAESIHRLGCGPSSAVRMNIKAASLLSDEHSLIHQ
jgi:hypothetical protein